MPNYDYMCGDRHVEAFVKYEERHNFTLNGVRCVLVFRSFPGMCIPEHHKSAPNMNPVELDRYKKARNGDGDLRIYERGMDDDIKRNAKYRDLQNKYEIEQVVHKVAEEVLMH